MGKDGDPGPSESRHRPQTHEKCASNGRTSYDAHKVRVTRHIPPRPVEGKVAEKYWNRYAANANAKVDASVRTRSHLRVNYAASLYLFCTKPVNFSFTPASRKLIAS